MSEENTSWKPVISELPAILSYNSAKNITALRLMNLIPTQIDSYYRYSGSLTTPECDEIVNWVVIENPVIQISNEQLVAFQMMKDAGGREVCFKFLHSYNKSIIFNFAFF